MMKKLRIEEEWKNELTREQYQVMRKAGTEPAFTGKYNRQKTWNVHLCCLRTAAVQFRYEV